MAKILLNLAATRMLYEAPSYISTRTIAFNKKKKAAAINAGAKATQPETQAFAENRRS